MAGFVSRRSADRWNNAARIVEGAGAGNRQVPGIYRTPRVVCDDLPLPGSYPAVAGATIPAGAVGPVLYNEVLYAVRNQSQCQVLIGDKVGLHVSPDCEAFFVPCVCSCSPSAPACCDKVIAVCVNGITALLNVSTGIYSWDVSDCCDCEGATLEIALTCTTDTITCTWDYTCGVNTDTGTLDWSGLCDDPVTEYEDTISADGCSLMLNATIAATECGPCESAPGLCTECTAITALTDNGGFTKAVTNIESADFTFSQMTFETNDIFTITIDLSMVGSDDTESGTLTVGLPGCSVLSATPNGNGNGLEDLPPTITNPTECTGNATVVWGQTLETGTAYQFVITARFNYCGGLNPPFQFTWARLLGAGSSQGINWPKTCGACV